MPKLINILPLGSDLNVDVMCAWIFENPSVYHSNSIAIHFNAFIDILYYNFLLFQFCKF